MYQNKHRTRYRLQSGQALIMLLVFMTVAMIVTMAAVAVTVINARATSAYDLGEESLTIAESGADNAIVQLLRNPNYAGETLTVGNGTATITVSGTTTKTITSVSVNGGFRRTIQVVGSFSANVFTISSWAEI